MGGRRRCYLAPERFFEGSAAAINTSAPLQPDMVRHVFVNLQAVMILVMDILSTLYNTATADHTCVVVSA